MLEAEILKANGEAQSLLYPLSEDIIICKKIRKLCQEKVSQFKYDD